MNYWTIPKQTLLHTKQFSFSNFKPFLPIYLPVYLSIYLGFHQDLAALSKRDGQHLLPSSSDIDLNKKISVLNELSGNDYKVAALSKSYLTFIVIIIQSLKSLGQF